jgi:anti-sigma-K factor RskA
MHTNPDLLALLALGEDVGTEEDLVHIAECPGCRAELAALTAAAGTARRTTERDVLVAPRPEVWQRISHELHLHALPSLDGATASPPAPAGAAAPLAPAAGQTSRRRTRMAAFALAAVLALVVGIGLGANLDRILPGQREQASVQLNALPGWSGSQGRATIEEDRDGNRLLVVQAKSPEPSTGPREVWLTNSQADPMFAMGFLQADGSGRFPIPPSMDLKEFRLVDVSQEPEHDHDPGHSGKSILRGKLPV